MGHEDTQEMTITAFDPPESYEIVSKSLGSDFQTTFRFAEQPGGTEVTLDVQIEARSLAATLMTGLANPMFGPCCELMADDLDDLKRVAEARKISSSHSS